MLRKTQEEKDFANFQIFDDKTQPYASTNFTYSEEQFDKLVKLCEYNTLFSVETIKAEIAEIIAKKQQPQGPPKFKEMVALIHKINKIRSNKQSSVSSDVRSQQVRGSLNIIIPEEKEKELRQYCSVNEPPPDESSSSGNYSSASEGGFSFSEP